MPSTNPQINEALAAANAKRAAQAELSGELYREELSLAEALADTRLAKNTTVETVLCWQYGRGVHAARRTSRRADVIPGKRASTLTARQIDALVEAAVLAPRRGPRERKHDRPRDPTRVYRR